ncbi:isoleucine--tRNA ligase [Candidatus Gottesmanbacteria bacterium RIFCSPHIGHO2_02_FULL_39_11]|uniref:Isoleucine--tRNA ligase n=1 Tax=Candidatus Gottesmanbacteria bacterium RIFCSPHIGHO2_02_FULL_39_11 TaxID=1798382 RepID=A0A1F5ZW03_9BACT|nr:MAG: isoleucine--tRNA ligase [Candidatus Gottesmanbacteria bacterium RIFCSPHIGHO2_02_FULL_39_11]
MFKPVSSQVNFPELENKILNHWYKDGVIAKYLAKNSKAKKGFSFLDGPITANNPMGVHHGWGRTYKDLWQRYHTMKGDQQRYQNGFDCQGLWVEVEVEKELGLRNKKDIENLIPGDKSASIAKFVQLCKERVLKFSKIQTEQSKRLGYFMDWDHSYYTMSDENNYMIWHFLKVCHEKGWIYKGKDSVPWCPRCETAISQHEMLTEDYKEVVHESVYLKLPLVGKEKEYILVWTTTPWTIPANIAVAVDANVDYAQVKLENGDLVWLGKESTQRVLGKNITMEKTVKGKELAGLKYKGPYDNLPAVEKISQDPKFHTIIPTDPLIMPISPLEGTEMVHTAVSAGTEDFHLGKKLKLPMIPVIDDTATYIEGLGDLKGKNAKKHPEIIIDFLKQNSWVLKTEQYKHRYPACWRCKTELVWKVAEEWYIAMDKKEKERKGEKEKESKTLREKMIESAKMIEWMPEFGLERELDWLSHMSDWLISKPNRYWGLALPIYECKECGWFDVIGGKDELKEKAVSGWNEFESHTPHKPYIDQVTISCPNCKKEVSRILDVGNVWLDAGIVPFSTFIDPKTHKLSYITDKKYWRSWFPVDFITESFPGQFKNWFYSMIAMSTVLEGRNPFKRVLGYASVLGEDGRPMHKSWGNSIEFNEAADKIGVDVMRFMYCSQNPEQNLLFGYKKADEARRSFHLLLWNIYNFFITYALIDKRSQGSLQTSKNILDKWIIARLEEVIKRVTFALDQYHPSLATESFSSFVNDFSTWYIRRSRDRVGPTANDEKDKTQFYATTFSVLTTLSKILAPFVPFISEEIFTNLTGKESVHLEDWPITDEKKIDQKLISEMNKARELTTYGHAKRKLGGIKVRIPIFKLSFDAPSEYDDIRDDIRSLVLDELNAKNIIVNGSQWFPKKEVKVSDESLKAEGEARDIVRTVQVKRKELGCSLDEKVIVTLPNIPAGFENWIKTQTLAKELKIGPAISVSRLQA